MTKDCCKAIRKLKKCRPKTKKRHSKKGDCIVISDDNRNRKAPLIVIHNRNDTKQASAQEDIQKDAQLETQENKQGTKQKAAQKGESKR